MVWDEPGTDRPPRSCAGRETGERLGYDGNELWWSVARLRR